MFMISCPLCFEQDDSIYHLFSHCKVVSFVWNGVNSWSGVNMGTQSVSVAHYRMYGLLVVGKNTKPTFGIAVGAS